ncbi:MAG: hypothetical protein J0M01_07610 [Dechloromonas sp.]|jgi:hypothetical protein|nr:hypothetical protein [Dechloromonas sp.]
MTPLLLAELSRLPLFPRSASDLIRVAGPEAAAALIGAWPGQQFPVPAVVGGGNPAGARRWAQLAEIVGEAAAARIVQWCPGADLYIPSLKEVIWSRAQDAIRADFDRLTTAGGYSVREAVFELGIQYGCSGKAIENAIARPDNVRGEPVQGVLF